MTQRSRRQVGSATVAALVVAIVGVGGVFAWLRAALPSEPAAILADAWDWTDAGVRVIPVGDGSPFAGGDRVTAIDGVPVAQLASVALGLPAADPPGAVAGEPRVFTVERSTGSVDLAVRMGPQPVGGLLLAALPLLAYTVAQAGVALLAWLRRPAEGWRRGFLLGSVANVTNALIWELGLRPTDLDAGSPMLLLFALGVPLHLLFWSSVVHVMVSWPDRASGVLGSRGFVTAVYALPQAAVAVALAGAAVLLPTAPGWLSFAERTVALVVLVLTGVILVALVAAYRRIRPTAGRPLRLIVAGCVVGALAVGGLTALPVLLTGDPLAPRAGVAAIGLPLAVVLLIGTLRSRLFEVDLLVASRRRLVVAREEERRRIRRDLHDGIGPMLAAMTLKADLARDLVHDDPDAAQAALAGLKADTQAAIAEIRRLTRDLRPPALDELGLAEAIRQRADELARAGGDGRIEIAVSATHPLPELAAAVEVAAYRIALEAMTNVVRHTPARRCEVRIETSGRLAIEVRDDGPGFAPDHPHGVGMVSMRERCAELGGSLWLGRTADGWTVVRATLPLDG